MHTGAHLQLGVQRLQLCAGVLQAEGVAPRGLQLLPDAVAGLLGPGRPEQQGLSLRQQHGLLGRAREGGEGGGAVRAVGRYGSMEQEYVLS